MSLDAPASPPAASGCHAEFSPCPQPGSSRPVPAAGGGSAATESPSSTSAEAPGLQLSVHLGLASGESLQLVAGPDWTVMRLVRECQQGRGELDFQVDVVHED